MGLLSHCVRCDKSLTAVAPARLSPEFGALGQRLLDHGRAVLAALLHGHVRVEDEPSVLPLRTLLQLYQRGLIPRGSAPWMTTNA